jgi:phytoene dehydrogenase-like protein
MKDEAKANRDRKMADLETKREAMRAKLDEVGRSSAEAWKDVQKGAQSAWDELDKSFREASREF